MNHHQRAEFIARHGEPEGPEYAEHKELCECVDCVRSLGAVCEACKDVRLKKGEIDICKKCEIEFYRQEW